MGYAHPTEPQCNYDPVEGLPLAPDADPLEKIRALEEQILRLKTQLENRPTATSSASSQLQADPRSLSQDDYISDTSTVSPAGGIVLPRASLNIHTDVYHDDSYSTPNPQPLLMDFSVNHAGSDPFFSLLPSGWNTDLPEPHIMIHLVDVFFRCDPCGSRILHRPSFMASLRLHPKHRDFPHTAILHAICACASRWASRDIVTAPDGTRRDPFAEYHVGKTRQYIDRTMATGADIFSVLQACILLSWYLYADGRWVEVWIFAGFQTRSAIPLRLNYPGTFTTQGRNAPGAYLAPPRDQQELETRRRTWWMAVMFDRIASMGGWVHSIDERDIGTEFPLRQEEFYSNRQVPSNRQDMFTKDLFTIHPPLYTDSFILFLKAMMLFGRVTDYQVRGNLQQSSLPSTSQDPFHLPGFEALDRLVCHDFIENLPSIYKNNYGLGTAMSGGVLDTDAYMLHVAPHAAAISLHTHFINWGEPNNVSAQRCLNASQSILSAYYVLSATSLDISRLHPFVTICWYLAAVVQIHLCKYFIEIGDLERESAAWSDINLLRFAMIEYGNRSPIGTRQEKLLQGLMGEIVKMTSHKTPLQMGVPLFPFSHATAFAKRGGADDGDSPGPVAPLPVSPEFEASTVAGGRSPVAPPVSSSPWTTPGSNKATSLSPRVVPVLAGPKLYM